MKSSLPPRSADTSASTPSAPVNRQYFRCQPNRQYPRRRAKRASSFQKRGGLTLRVSKVARSAFCLRLTEVRYELNSHRTNRHQQPYAKRHFETRLRAMTCGEDVVRDFGKEACDVIASERPLEGVWEGDGVPLVTHLKASPLPCHSPSLQPNQPAHPPCQIPRHSGPPHRIHHPTLAPHLAGCCSPAYYQPAQCASPPHVAYPLATRPEGTLGVVVGVPPPRRDEESHSSLGEGKPQLES